LVQVGGTWLQYEQGCMKGQGDIPTPQGERRERHLCTMMQHV
jgi:hypothetical protein